MKTTLCIMNAAAAVFLGIVLGGILSGAVVSVLIVNGAIAGLSNTAISMVVLAPAVLLGAAGAFLELTCARYRVVAFFQGSLLRKSAVILGLFLAVIGGVMLSRRINKAASGEYRSLAGEIVRKIALSGGTGPAVEIANRPPVDCAVVAEGYALTERALVNTGKVDKMPARSIARGNIENEGVYLYLVRNNRVVAAARFGPDITVDNRVMLVPGAAVLRFPVRRAKPSGPGRRELLLITQQ